MKKYSVLILSVFILALGSCKKDHDDTTVEPPDTYPNFSSFAKGSYWIYQRFKVDSLGNSTATNVYDSCYVAGDTVINGNTYVITYRPEIYPSPNSSPYELVRDSLHYIVDVSGKIIFSSKDFTSVFNPYYETSSGTDTIYYSYSRMFDQNFSVQVPAGTFATSDYRLVVQFHPPYNINGTFRYIHRRYAENIGTITETLPFFMSDPTYTERRLIRYHIVTQ